MPYSKEEIQKTFLEIAEKLNVPPPYDELSFQEGYMAEPYVEIGEGGELYYVVKERGEELDRKKTESLNQLMYWLFSGITHTMAADYELKHRHPTNDFRRLLFEKQLELLGKVSQKWRNLREQEVKSILKDHPFIDKSNP